MEKIDVKTKIGYDFIGRKVYITFGENRVVALEHLMIKPEDIDLKNPKDGHECEKRQFMKIENVYLRNELGEQLGYSSKIKYEDVGAPFSTRYGATLNDYFLDSTTWITEDEYEKMNGNK